MKACELQLRSESMFYVSMGTEIRYVLDLTLKHCTSSNDTIKIFIVLGL